MVTPAAGVDVGPEDRVDTVLDPAHPLGTAFRSAVSNRLAGFVERQSAGLAAMGPSSLPSARWPARCWPAASGCDRRSSSGASSRRPGSRGPSTTVPLLDAAASFDLLHVSALVHDDVMDSSDLRRGQPAAHRRFETLHGREGWLGDGPAFGRAGAIVLGDLLIMWSAQLLGEAGLPADALARAVPLVDPMRTEVTCGQYLDMVVQARPLPRWLPEVDGRPDLSAALADADRVTEHKSARYTVVRPVQVGAAIGGADAELVARLAAYGSPLGRAFQLRDDLLGVFGDPEVTGKPAGDDLREGKRTVLVAQAYAQTDAAGRRLLEELLGDPDLGADGVQRLQDVITASGATVQVEARIEAAYEESLAALDAAEITAEGRAALHALADAAVRRSS